MAAKDRRNKDQKRKAKLVAREKRRASNRGPEPYSGRKYQADAWVTHVYQTELAIYETILLSERHLKNEQVKEVLIQLINHLRQGHAPLLAADAPEVAFAPGNEVAFLVWNIRQHWAILFQEQGPVQKDDLVGILRTLLHSIEAHAWNTGPDRGYVAFLPGFMKRAPLY